MRIESPFGAHFIVNGWSAPNDREENHTYAQMTRVREWDRIYAAGWIPLADGWKRPRTITFE